MENRLDRTRKGQEDNGEFPTTLGADAVFRGQLEVERGVKLLGRFEGEITSKAEIAIAEGATMTGDMNAEGIRIEGTVAGNMTAGAKIQLTESAKLEGDLETPRLEVAEGAILVGRCVVGVTGPTNGKRPGVAKSASAAKSTTSAKASKAEPKEEEPAEAAKDAN